MSGTTAGVHFEKTGDDLHMRVYRGKTISFEVIWGCFENDRIFGEWTGYHNEERMHTVLGSRMPQEAYVAGSPMGIMDKPASLPAYPQAQ